MVEDKESVARELCYTLTECSYSLQVPEHVRKGEVENVAGRHDPQWSGIGRGWPGYHNMIRFQLLGILQQPVIQALDYYCRWVVANTCALVWSM